MDSVVKTLKVAIANINSNINSLKSVTQENDKLLHKMIQNLEDKKAEHENAINLLEGVTKKND